MDMVDSRSSARLSPLPLVHVLITNSRQVLSCWARRKVGERVVRGRRLRSRGWPADRADRRPTVPTAGPEKLYLLCCCASHRASP